jgi:hypothetical protein
MASKLANPLSQPWRGEGSQAGLVGSTNQEYQPRRCFRQGSRLYAAGKEIRDFLINTWPAFLSFYISRLIKPVDVFFN